jgi:hypothetical protein
VENAELNDVSRFSLRQYAIGSKSGTLRMSLHDGPGNHVLRDGENVEFVEVDVTTLDNVVNEMPSATFIKADIEGFELEMLKGAVELMKSDRLAGFLIETFRPHNWQQENLRAIEAILRENGFMPYHFNVESNEIVPLENPQDGGNNTFYFRSRDLVKSRLAEIAK